MAGGAGNRKREGLRLHSEFEGPGRHRVSIVVRSQVFDRLGRLMVDRGLSQAEGLAAILEAGCVAVESGVVLCERLGNGAASVEVARAA